MTCISRKIKKAVRTLEKNKQSDSLVLVACDKDITEIISLPEFIEPGYLHRHVPGTVGNIFGVLVSRDFFGQTFRDSVLIGVSESGFVGSARLDDYWEADCVVQG